MKKRNRLLLFPVILSVACQSSASLPFKEGDSLTELYDFLKTEEVEYSYYSSFGLFQYENLTYIVTEQEFGFSIIKIKAYKPHLPSVYDFYQLKMDMDIYDVADCVGAPSQIDQTSSSFHILYNTKEEKIVSIGFTILNNQAIFEGRMHVIARE